tara:strand:+ start:2263 stop:4749 length:2487 start_codon:yes stop_codon:yes gene_type:complete
MATSSMDKGLYAAPLGLDEDAGAELEIGIEAEIPLGGEGAEVEIEELEDGGVEVSFGPSDDDDDEEGGFGENLAELLDEGVLQDLSGDLVELIETDIGSRKEWADTFVKGMDVLGFKYEERTEPWDDACGVYSTVLAEAAIRFQAETMSETFPAAGPVKTKILGKVTKEKEDAAERVRTDMNYQLTDRMVEYRPEHERMLYSLGLAGSAFKKVYFDPSMGRQVSIYVPAEDVIVPYGASNIEQAERVTHVMRKTENEMKRLMAQGFYRDVELGEPESFPSDIEKKKAEDGGYSLTNDERYTVFEVHADLCIDGVDDDEDELAKPYVVTIERGTGEVLAIRRNWDEEDPLTLKRDHFVHYVYVPGFGFYGLGLIHIIGGYARAGTALIRQLVDAGTLSNLPGGLKSRGLRVKGDDTPIAPGEFRDVDVPSGNIKDNIMTLPYKEPSQTLLALLQRITEEGRRLGAISDMNVSDMSANAPVGTTLALLERQLKPMAAVQSRVHYAMKLEFKLLKGIIAEYAPEDYQYEPESGLARARKEDYAMVDVIPVSDPNSSTMAQRVVQYQAVFQMAQSAPQIYDLPYLHRQMIEVLGVKNADKMVPMSEDQKPRDPVSENMSILIGKPVKAFIYQDHEAHIAAHQSFIQDPMIAQTIGQNPQAQGMMSAMQAHIAEHLGFNYRKQIEERLGAPLPAPDEQMPEDMEIQLARLVADAGKQLTQAHQQQAAQEQAQQQAQDPMFQLQQAEVQVKQAEVQRKQQKDQTDAQIAGAKLQLDQQRVQIEAQKEGARLQSQEKQNSARLNTQERQQQAKLKLDALKVLATPKQPRQPGKKG